MHRILRIAGDGIALINNYCNGFEVVVIAIGAAALVVWLVSMWRRGGQYIGKVHHVASLLGIVVCCILYTFVTNAAIDKRVVSTYFGNIAFAYEDYGLPYCFSLIPAPSLRKYFEESFLPTPAEARRLYSDT